MNLSFRSLYVFGVTYTSIHIREYWPNFIIFSIFFIIGKILNSIRLSKRNEKFLAKSIVHFRGKTRHNKVMFTLLLKHRVIYSAAHDYHSIHAVHDASQLNGCYAALLSQPSVQHQISTNISMIILKIKFMKANKKSSKNI